MKKLEMPSKILRWFTFVIAFFGVWTLVVIVHYSHNLALFYSEIVNESTATMSRTSVSIVLNTNNMNEDSIFKGINLSINSEESPSSNRRKFLPSVGTSKAVAKPLSSHYLNTLYESTTNRRYVVLSKEGFHYFASLKQDHKILWSEEPYLKRRNEFRRRCNSMSTSPIVDLSRMVYDDKHQVVMCVVPKAACTTWKRYMYYLLGKETDKTKLMDINSGNLVLGAAKNQLPLLSSLSTKEALKRLATYTTFMVTRHPFERLVSAHSSKFTGRSSAVSPYKMDKGRNIALRQAKFYLNGLRYFTAGGRYVLVKDEAFENLNNSQQEASLQYVEVMNNGKVSFRQLMEDIVYNPKKDYETDVHWRPQVILCNPCAVNYDFIVRFENIARDGNYLLKYLQRNDPEETRTYFDESISPLIDESRTAKAFDQINEDTIFRLKSIYENDFRTMGYSSDHFA